MQYIRNIETTSARDQLEQELLAIQHAITSSWNHIAPFWPLKNLIATNPLRGFEDKTFEEALKLGNTYFQQGMLPEPMQTVNRETIKWLQVFFDEGQAAIKMPLRHLGFFKSIYTLLKFDKNIFYFNTKDNKLTWYLGLSENIELVIHECLNYLEISNEKCNEFLTLMLTTLPGWASYIQYKTSWEAIKDNRYKFVITKEEYLAFRLLMTCLLFPQGKTLLSWYEHAVDTKKNGSMLKIIKNLEKNYKKNVLEHIHFAMKNNDKEHADIEAQLIFCIDVRSEGFRRALEEQDHYETYGFAGFFGIPIAIQNEVTGDKYASCPVLLTPQHNILINKNNIKAVHIHARKNLVKKLYQSLKYNVATPFALAEFIGGIAALMMLGRTFFPKLASKIRSLYKKILEELPNPKAIDSISLKDQCTYAANALKMMGLIKNFAPLIVFCGHGSETQNNAYASALDCGACGGRPGGKNAFILASILNKEEVRSCLKEEGIFIPDSTYFLAAEHNTTTDLVKIFDQHLPPTKRAELTKLKNDLQKAQEININRRFGELATTQHRKLSPKVRAKDWAQIRPEWGLAGNASFIVAPRTITRNVDLQGRAFLHSYDWTIDSTGSLLTTILTAPMIVAQWINCQYLFSTIDNVAYGAGSKITKNITGKIGVMQGNASDLMHGLPLQSVFKNDKESYHEPVRLLTIVYAPKALLMQIILQNEILKKLFVNEWVHLVCIDPQDDIHYNLTRTLKWES